MNQKLLKFYVGCKTLRNNEQGGISVEYALLAGVIAAIVGAIVLGKDEIAKAFVDKIKEAFGAE